MDQTLLNTPTPTIPSSTGWETSRLVGNYVRLWPYARGLYPRDLPYKLWRAMEDDGAAGRVFHGTLQPEGSTVDCRGDLVDFMPLFDPLKAAVLIAEALDTGEIAGLNWYTDMVEQDRATGNVFYRRKYWGHAAREGTRIAMDYGFNNLHFKSIWASTPWKIAARHAEACGFSQVAVLPSLARLNGARSDVYVLKIEKEEFLCPRQ